MIRESVLKLRHRLGLLKREDYTKSLLTEREQFIESLPNQVRGRVAHVLRKTDSLQVAGDLPTFMQTCMEASKELEWVAKEYGPEGLGEETYGKICHLIGMDDAGYRPQTARGWRFFLNPFALFSFYYEHHYAFNAAVEIIMTEVIHDHWSLVPANPDPTNLPTPDETLEAQRKLEAAGITDLRLTLLKNGMVYGNSVLLPKRNPFPGAVVGFEPLVMDRLMPCLDKIDSSLLGWDYWYGTHSFFYPSEKVLHFNPNPCMRIPQLGLPPLTPLITDIESDFFASALQRTAMEKAGMLGLIIVTSAPENQGVLAGKRDKFSEYLQKEIQNSFSGWKNAHGILVSNYIERVEKLSQFGDFDANFLKFRVEVAKAICIILQVPPEKISINRSQGLQYQAALVEDQINATFDKSVYAKVSKGDDFLNKNALPLMGVDKFKIQANGRFGGLTLNGARCGLVASQIGGMFTFNEERDCFFGMSPLPAWDSRGHRIADNSSDRDPAMIPAEYAPRNEKEARDLDAERKKARCQHTETTKPTPKENTEK